MYIFSLRNGKEAEEKGRGAGGQPLVSSVLHNCIKLSAIYGQRKAPSREIILLSGM